MPMVTININFGENIPINIYAKKVFTDREWAGDAEISMIPLVFNDICAATSSLINEINTNSLLGYEYINTYGNLNDTKLSILILVNINDNHLVNGYYNDLNAFPNFNFKIPNYTKKIKNL